MFEIDLSQKSFQFCQNISFKAIQNGNKLHSAPGLNRGLSSNFWWLRCANHVKFTKECDVYRETSFSQKIFTNELNMVLPLQAWIKRQCMEWKRTDFPENKRFRVLYSVKLVILTVFWNMKGPITIVFLEKAATVNSASYFQLLRQNSHHLLNDSYIYIIKYKIGW